MTLKIYSDVFRQALSNRNGKFWCVDLTLFYNYWVPAQLNYNTYFHLVTFATQQLRPTSKFAGVGGIHKKDGDRRITITTVYLGQEGNILNINTIIPIQSLTFLVQNHSNGAEKIRLR